MPQSSYGYSDGAASPADRLRRWDLFRILLRSFLMQGSWNPARMLHHGFLFAVLPGFRRLTADRTELDAMIQRHSAFFNTHPVFASFICGGVLRLEEIRLAGDSADSAVIEKFKTRLSHLLGSLGDRFFWKSLRPVAILSGLVLAAGGAGWEWVVGVPLVVYNGPHVYVRWYGLTSGYRYGLQVLPHIGVEQFENAMRVLNAMGFGLIGALVVAVGVAAGQSGSTAVGVFLGTMVLTTVLSHRRVHPMVVILVPLVLAVAAGLWIFPDILSTVPGR